jgi:hypothetical protein
MKIKEERLWLLMEGENSTTKVNVILLGLTPTNHLVGSIMDIEEVLATLLVNLSSTRGILTSCNYVVWSHRL